MASSMVHQFAIEPKMGVGPARLGMHKDEASVPFTHVYTGFFKGAESKVRSDRCEAIGLIIHYDDASRVEFIEVIEALHAEVTLELYRRGATSPRPWGRPYEYESERLEAIFAWFNEHLPCPPFGRKLGSGGWTRDGVAWFRSEAKEPIGRMWDIVAILEEHGVAVRLVVTAKPGKLVYEDEYQVVAETPCWA